MYLVFIFSVSKDHAVWVLLNIIFLSEVIYAQEFLQRR